jgi:hypothetical protein
MVILFRKLFTDHPESVGETYAEHLFAAMGFGVRMVFAGIACMVHGVLPALFMNRGSDTVRVLHDRMVARRRQRMPNSLIQ